MSLIITCKESFYSIVCGPYDEVDLLPNIILFS